MPKISVVVPAYNVEQYIALCLDSLVKQTYRDLEIIVVDDGSNDSTPTIIDNFSKNDSRIKVIHIPNGGVSNARNIGMASSTGDYLGFVDSDDYVSENMYELMMNIAIREDYDVVQCAYYYCDGEKRELIASVDNIAVSSEKCLKLLFGGEKVRAKICNKIYKASLAKTVLFNTSVHANEDFLFNYNIIKKANKVFLCNSGLYFYQKHKESTTSAILSEKRLTILDVANNVLNDCEDTDLYNYALKKYTFSYFQIINEIIETKLFYDLLDKCIKCLRDKKKSIYKNNLIPRYVKIALWSVLHLKPIYKVAVLIRHRIQRP